MKILIVGNPVFDTHYSIHAFATILASELKSRNWDVVSASAGAGRKVGGGYLATRFEKFVRFPNSLRKLSRDCDVMHICEHGYASYTRWSKAKATTVTCHDLVVVKASRGEIPDWPVSKRTQMYQESILQDLRRADRIASVSEATRDDVLRLANPEKSRVRVIYNGFYRPPLVHDRAQATEILKKAGLPYEQPYFVNVSGAQPNKNRPGLLKIYAEIQRQMGTAAPHLCLVGAKLNEEQTKLVGQLPDQSKFHSIVRPSDEEVQSLLTLSTMLIYPSLYEGFGLPIIEAQRQGTAVATTQWAPMSEVAGDGAVLFDPKDPAGAAAAIVRGLPDRDRLAQAGLANIKRFTLDAMIDGYDSLFREVTG